MRLGVQTPQDAPSWAAWQDGDGRSSAIRTSALPLRKLQGLHPPALSTSQCVARVVTRGRNRWPGISPMDAPSPRVLDAQDKAAPALGSRPVSSLWGVDLHFWGHPSKTPMWSCHSPAAKPTSLYMTLLFPGAKLLTQQASPSSLPLEPSAAWLLTHTHRTHG